MNTVNAGVLAEMAPAIRSSMPMAPGGPVPGDFFRPRTLAGAVQAAVDEVPGEELRPLAGELRDCRVGARTWLALLVRCYAQQVYASAAVAAQAARDPDLPWFWWDGQPEARAVRQFRMDNRSPVHRCLVAALQFQVEERMFAGLVTKVNRPQLAEEANRRIIMAAFADSQELAAA